MSARVISVEFSDGVNTYIPGQDGSGLAWDWVGTNATGAITNMAYRTEFSDGSD